MTTTKNYVLVERPDTTVRGPRGPRTPSHVNKLERIKEVSAQLFYQQGYAATDLRRIADGLDMHVSTLYNYIPGKEDLLYLIMRDGIEQITEGLHRALASADDPAGKLRAAFRAHVLHHAHRRFLAWTSHVELRSLTGAYLEDISRRRHAYEELWLQLLREGMAAGVFAAGDPQLALYGLLAVGQSVSRWYRPGGRLSAEEIADELADRALGGVLVR